MKKQDKTQNILESNKILLDELLKEEHESTDKGKIDYIKGALENLSSDDLDKIYLSVEEHDPEYEKEHIEEGIGEPKRVSYDVMIHKLNMGRELGEPDLSQMVDEVITDLTAYLDDGTSITGNKNVWPFK